MAHAYLLSGGWMGAREAVAVFFAQLLLCCQPKEIDGLLMPCGVCMHCRKTGHGTHPDLFICPSEEDGTIKIEHVRLLQKTVSFAPLEAGKRVCLVLNCEKMTMDAANALLKILEEPPKDNHLFLTASATETLLPTIVSRCQVLKCLPDPFNMDCFLPEEQTALQMYPLWFWEGICAGDPGVVRGLLQLDVVHLRNRLWRLLRRGAGIALFFQLMQEFSESNSTVLCLKLLVMSIVRDILLQLGGDNPSLLLNKDRAQEVIALAGVIPVWEIEQYLDTLDKVEYLLERNINKTLLVETLLAFWLERLSL